eukprot:scaffold76759_cov45-Phaeocystis_antarctica.AAC.1
MARALLEEVGVQDVRRGVSVVALSVCASKVTPEGLGLGSGLADLRRWLEEAGRVRQHRVGCGRERRCLGARLAAHGHAPARPASRLWGGHGEG